MSLKTGKLNPNWSKAIAEAAERLLAELSGKEKEQLKNTPEKELIIFPWACLSEITLGYGLATYTRVITRKHTT